MLELVLESADSNYRLCNGYHIDVALAILAIELWER